MSRSDDFESWLRERNPDQEEFIHAVLDIASDVIPIINANTQYKRHEVLRRLAEPDRIISFKVVWEDDSGRVCVNRGWRVQQSNVLGPYKGGLRFHAALNESILKFLAFEQCFKNALTGLSLGGGKGGSNFNPVGRSDREIMRFCQAYMSELFRHIGPVTDVPAGDINVGKREIGYLYGQYRRLANEFGGSITGKHVEFGGSHIREEATGFGVVYFAANVLAAQKTQLEGQRIAISGAGNVALFAAHKAAALDAKVISLSNSKGTLHCSDGLTLPLIDKLMKLSNADNALAELAQEGGGEWLENATPWQIPCDIAMPCATQHEVNHSDAKAMVDNGAHLLIEGSNMPLTEEASTIIRNASSVSYVPGKASNAGGVAVSGLEMSQNAQFHQLSFKEMDKRLKQLISRIHDQCRDEGKTGNASRAVDYARGANVAAFRRLADALVAQGY